MKHIIVRVSAAALAAAALVLLAAPARAANPTVQDIIDHIDKVSEIKSDVTAQVKITARDEDMGGTKIIEAIWYRRDADDAFLFVMTAPPTDRGNGYLRVGGNSWYYLSKSRTFQHIGRGDKIGGSNVTAEDVESRKFGELYKPDVDDSGKEKIREETIGKIPVFKIELVAKVVDVKYPRRIMWVTREKFLILKEEYYSLSGTLLQTGYYKNYKEVDGRYIPLVSKFEDAIQKDNVSLMEVKGISFAKVENAKFDKRYLESLSK